MLLRYWGERDIAAESFAHLVDRSAAGIRTTALVAELRGRGWEAAPIDGGEMTARAELARGRPVLALIEDRPGTFHYVVVVAWHERGVVFHDPARVPFRVMTTAEFDRRWRATDRWMAVVVPGEMTSPGNVTVPADTAVTACEALIAEGVREAQANNLDAAERSLTSALACPGPAAVRELAGVRLLQKRWPEVTELASAAVDADPSDTYAWKLLATSRYLQNDREGALEAWNRAGEPRLDLIRVDGLRRTRHRVVEQLTGLTAGDLLTPDGVLRARRQIAELPAAASTRLDYTPVPSGLAELHGAVVERPAFPASRWPLVGVGVSAAARREIGVTFGSPTGGGEAVTLAWRFWPRRPRVAADLHAPAPWGGLWGVDAFTERQPFTDAAMPQSERTGALLRVSRWATGTVRVEAGAGVDRWRGRSTLGRLAGTARWLSTADRFGVRVGSDVWLGEQPFSQFNAAATARSSRELRGFVATANAAFHATTATTPRGLWLAGDTGHARSTLLRAHPVLDEGRLRVDRLGRMLAAMTIEGQHWWGPRGPLRVGAAAFADVGRTSKTVSGRTMLDADVGAGVRISAAGLPGLMRIDLAKGLRDGSTAVSFVYEP